MKAVAALMLLTVACATAGDDTHEGIDAPGSSPDARPPIGGADAPQLPDARLMVDASGGTPDAMVSAGCTTMATWGDQGPVDGNASESIDIISGSRLQEVLPSTGKQTEGSTPHQLVHPSGESGKRSSLTRGSPPEVRIQAPFMKSSPVRLLAIQRR